MFITKYAFICIISLPVIISSTCPPSFLGRCFCGDAKFPLQGTTEKYVVNCTNSDFKNAKPLQDLPDETEVLIFKGNHLNELDINLFGVNSNTFDDLEYIDMSNNHITFIKGKTFHKVSSVETLILSFNDINIMGKKNKPRIFSNFVNLKNLHLTDAFSDKLNGSTYYLLNMEDIFDESELTKLQKIHLEQNDIWSIGSDESIFCPLTSLQHIYLADNKLSDMDFKIDCMKNLNYIDLRFNSINKLSNEAMKRLDEYALIRADIKINLKNNPFICDCMAEVFLKWIKKTNVYKREKEKYFCKEGFPKDNVDKQLEMVKEVSCPNAKKLDGYSSKTVGFLSFLVAFLCISVIVVIYYYNKRLSIVMQPILNEFTKRMGYTGLKREEQTQDVQL